MSTLCIFAKAPVPGRAKTRTQTLLSAEQAGQLQGCLTRDTLAMSRGRARRVLYVAEGLDHPFLVELAAAEEVAREPQRGDDLGARMATALRECGAEAGAPVCIIGTDSPHLPPEVLDQAFAALARVPVVLGPAGDGGYYLIGARGPLPPIFDQMRWGTEEVLAETLRRLEAAGLPYELLPFWYDIDLPADLRLLAAHLPALQRARPGTCAATAALLAELGLLAR